MSREQRPFFPPNVNIPVAGRSLKDWPGPSLCFGTCPHRPAVMAKELHHPAITISPWLRALTIKMLGMRLSWLFPGSQVPTSSSPCSASSILFTCLDLLGLSSP